MRSSMPGATLSLVLLAALASCEETHGHSAPAPEWVYSEVEANNSVLTANVVGSAFVGDQYTILGTITDNGSDPFDGFIFFPQEDLDIEFALDAQSSGALLEICALDPFFSPIPICWDTTVNPARGFIPAYAGQELHLVISSLWGTSNYELQVDCFPPVYAATASTEAAAVQGSGERVAAYLGTAVQAPVPASELIVVDSTGEVHAFALGLDDRGPFIEPAERR